MRNSFSPSELPKPTAFRRMSNEQKFKADGRVELLYFSHSSEPRRAVAPWNPHRHRRVSLMRQRERPTWVEWSTPLRPRRFTGPPTVTLSRRA